jgi:hypothetical protein
VTKRISKYFHANFPLLWRLDKNFNNLERLLCFERHRGFAFNDLSSRVWCWLLDWRDNRCMFATHAAETTLS